MKIKSMQSAIFSALFPRKTFLCLLAIALCNSISAKMEINQENKQNNVVINKEDQHQSETEVIDSKETIYPILILGSGPAGLTAALYGAISGFKTTVVAGPLQGGLLTTTSYIDNFPGVPHITGAELMKTMQKQAEEAGAGFLEETIESVDLTVWPFVLHAESGKIFKAQSLIIATGATPKKLEIQGEEDYWGNGVSSCALCDCMFFKKKKVAVVGGGDAAVEEAMQLAPYASGVTVLVRRDRMRAVQSMQEKLRAYKNVSVEYNKRVNQVVGDGEQVTGLEIEDTSIQSDNGQYATTGDAATEKGKRKDVLTHTATSALSKKEIKPYDGLFLAIGHIPQTELFKGQLELAESGHVHLEGRTQATSVPGVFAAGDVEDDEYRQAIVAAGHGCQAALEAIRFLRSKDIEPGK